jgi:hypothetical protein
VLFAHPLTDEAFHIDLTYLYSKLAEGVGRIAWKKQQQLSHREDPAFLSSLVLGIIADP